jgi:hypothetical protein
VFVENGVSTLNSTDIVESAGKEPSRHQLKLAGTRLLRQSKIDLQGVDH